MRRVMCVTLRQAEAGETRRCARAAARVAAVV